MPLESVHHLAHPSETVWIIKSASITSVRQDAQGITNAQSSMNAEEEFVYWLKSVDRMTIVPSPKLVLLPFPILAKGNVRMSAVALSFVVAMQSVKPAVTDPFVLALKVSLATQKMTKLAVRRNFVQPTLTVQEIAFVWISDVLRHSDQAAQQTENVVLKKFVSMVTVSIPVTIQQIVVSMPAAQFTTTTSSVLALKDLLAMLKSNVSEFQTLACQPNNVLVA